MVAFVSAAEAVQRVRSGDRVFMHGAAATPAVLLNALVARAETLEHVEIVHMHADGPAPHVACEMEGHLRHRALFIGANVREAVNEGRADFVPSLSFRHSAAVQQWRTAARRGLHPREST